jgi:hypothetical protein
MADLKIREIVKKTIACCSVCAEYAFASQERSKRKNLFFPIWTTHREEVTGCTWGDSVDL